MNMIHKRLTETVLTLAVLLCSVAIAAEHTKESLAAVKKKIDAHEAVLVDVREKKEWDAGHVKGAIFLPLSELQDGIDPKELAKQLPEDRILYTHCVAGVRSKTACDILQKLGYEARCLKPGYEELIRETFKKADTQ